MSSGEAVAWLDDDYGCSCPPRECYCGMSEEAAEMERFNRQEDEIARTELDADWAEYFAANTGEDQ